MKTGKYMGAEKFKRNWLNRDAAFPAAEFAG